MRLTFALALSLVALVGASIPLAPAAIPHAPFTASLVEGHVVHLAVSADLPATGFAFPQGAGVPLAHPVSEARATVLGGSPTGPGMEFPGIRWMNDQFLVNPVWNPGPAPHRAHAAAAAILVGETMPDGRARFPCTGAVFVVPAGAPDPRLAALTYVESHHATDPNDRSSVTHLYQDAGADPVWVTPLLNHRMDLPDDGQTSCAPPADGALAASPGAQGQAYPGRDGAALSGLRYNALVVLFACDALLPCEHAATISHGTHGESATGGAAEGNSHAHNPYGPLGNQYGLHGVEGMHPTISVDVYFGSLEAPAPASYRLVDAEGSAAPFG